MCMSGRIQGTTPPDARRIDHGAMKRGGRGLVALLLAVGLAAGLAVPAAAAEPATSPYRLLVDDPAWSPDSPAANMIPGVGDQRQVVYRHVPPGRPTPQILRVVDRQTREVLAKATLNIPAGADRAIVFDPDASTLALAEGHWHLFTFDPEDEPDHVVVAGDFNGWSQTATPMRDRGDGVYRALVKLTEGVHHYKFVVDGNWITDPHGDPEFAVPDGYGGTNSGVFIGLDGRDLPPAEDEAILKVALRHDPSAVSDLNVVGNGLIRLSLRVQADDVDEAAVLVLPEPDGQWQRHALRRQGSKMGFDRYGALVGGLSGGETVDYVFELSDGPATVYLAADGAVEEAEVARRNAWAAPTEPDFRTPDWAKHAVWYQIFPERFRNGNPENDPGDAWFETKVEWTADWWATLPGERAGEENFYRGAGNVWKRRYGGDIQGVKEKLPYLRELGVNAIYFNPVFEGESMHKYDTADFRHIDDNFGVKGDLPVEGETDDPATWKWSKSDKVFLDFIEEAHRQGFKVVIDGVFNHVGRAHPFFQNVLAKGKNSKYADWFEITDWGDPQHWRPMDDPLEVHGKPGGIQWRAWDGDNGHLPVFKKHPTLGLAPGPREHIFAITKRWLAPDGDPSRGIDGWRLDVPGDIPHPFWVDWRKLVKDTKPDAYITGEIWSWAQPWLKGDQFDAVMNYRFADMCQDFFVDREWKITPSEFSERCYEIVNAYPYQVVLVLQNLFGSHDTDRFASMFVNPDAVYDAANRIQDNNPDYDPSKPTDRHYERMKQAVTFQHTYVGAPMTYYGDETGMWAPDDPSNRQPMVWRDLMPYDDPEIEFREDLFAIYRRVIAIRNELPVLRLGGFRTVLSEDRRQVFAFARELGDEAAYVVLNRSPRTQTVHVPVLEPLLEAPLVNLLDEQSVALADPASDDPDGRTTLELREAARTLRAKAGVVTIKLGAFDSAVIVPRAALQ